MTTSLEFRNLTRSYGRSVQALQDFNLRVKPGEFVTLLGPSGSGKSTILRLLAGFDQPTSGDILVDGQSVLGQPSYERNIGMVFQNYALFPHMTVFENIAFPLRVRDLRDDAIIAKVNRVMEITRLKQFEARFPRELSGGQQQRVALARAIVFDPKVLLMDEPLGALDRNLREQLKFEIKRIHAELKMTVLFVTHDQDEALVMSDRIIVMRDGKLEQDATPAEIYARPRNRFVAAFIGESNILPCRSKQGGLWCNDLPVPGSYGVTAEDVWLLVRPETISIDPVKSAEDSIPAQVVDTIFLGETTRYVVRALGEELVVKHQNRGGQVLAPQSEVFIHWDPSLVVPLAS